MFYGNWMSFIKDEAKITEIAIPGSHNSGTEGMNMFGRCQDGSLYEQAMYGVRKFDIRVRADRKGRVFIAHSVMKGVSLEKAFSDIKRILEDTDEFLILNIKTYAVQDIGPFVLKFKGSNETVSELIEKYLSPEKYALTDFEDIRKITMGDIRKSGKRYVIHSEKEEYRHSRNCYILEPWEPEVFGYKPEKFAKECLRYLKALDSKGFFWFQTQQTPGSGTENGITKWPVHLDKLDRPYFPGIMADIAADPKMLKKVNVVAGDFMTKDYMKANEILNLNLLKDVVKEDKIQEYKNAIGK